ncbi:Tetratricopeptide repeat-containing protein [Chishuiella changwenlii]|uniref:Gliding motility protein n=2 Tax=Chishuiella changwenlii TaxID=1434701 RepID=A0A1M7ALP5_9FLAO|nr:gliding motility protein [Chishuiella changwenlii]SHL43638.1 Tetratricopeptide repeat-containing protein [Chishuiella changwenlii]
MTAWFNGMFNAEEELNKKNTETQKNYTENYAKILPVGIEYFSVADSSSYNDSPSAGSLAIGNGGNRNNQNKVEKPTGFNAVETKASKAIEKHSMMIKGEEKNKLMGRAYLIIGKSLFYQQKYFESLDALNYVEKNFKDSKYAREASVYKTIAEIKGGNYFDGAEKLQELYEKDPYKSKELKTMIARTYAQFLIDQKKYEEALDPLQKAEYFSRNKEERVRLFYVMGQVFSKLGKQQEAGEAFLQVYKMKPGFDLEIKSQLAIAANFDPKVNNYSNYKENLLDVSKKGIYSSKKNEFYYGISEMAYRADKLDEAIEYAKLSLKEPVSDPHIRGLAYENYGNIKFKQNDYVYASAYYDSAQTSYTLKEDQDRIGVRNTALKTLMEKHYLVKKNDSILKLASLPKEQQSVFFTDIIDKLRKKEEKQIEEEKREMETFQLETKTASFTSSFGDNDKTKFYFYNQNLKTSGQQEFRRVWGGVSLKDNWRNSNAINTTIEDKQAQLTGQISAGNPRRFEIDYYLEQIPTSVKELNDLKVQRDTTQLALGVGYFDIFENSELAGKELKALVASPPKSEDIKLQATYQLYRIYKNRDQKLEEQYKQDILTHYPNTIYAGYILNPEVEFITAETKEASDAYIIAYNLYKEGKYDEVKTKVQEAITKFPTEIIIAKFALLNAYAIKQTGNDADFKQALEIVVTAYDKTDEAKQAKRLIDKLKKPKVDNTINNQEVNSQPVNQEIQQVGPPNPQRSNSQPIKQEEQQVGPPNPQRSNSQPIKLEEQQVGPPNPQRSNSQPIKQEEQQVGPPNPQRSNSQPIKEVN